MSKKILNNFSVLFLIFAIIIVLPFFKFGFLHSYLYSAPLFKEESSVLCLKNLYNTNLCKFKNICYDSNQKSLLFFLKPGSVIRGLKNFKDLQKLQLSSISNHNQFFANMSLIVNNSYEIKVPYYIISKSILFSRFKPDNIMHVIHDDLFPIFLTLEIICSGDPICFDKYHLVAHDNHPEGNFFDLYKVLSSDKIILLGKLPPNKVVCFEEMLTGLVTNSIFYQYGFKKPHGPVNNTNLDINDVLNFSSFLKNKFNIKKVENQQSEIVLINREKSRKIINIKEVIEMIKQAYQQVTQKDQVNIVVLDLHLNKTEALIKAVSSADILVGMHGAEMIFGLFMKPYAAIIELFPYAIQPKVVSFIKPISDLEGMNLFYYSWKNNYRNNSVAHPDAHPLYGGIQHLDEVVQNKIKAINEVPPVECCNNPVYLYYMYQDTFVSGEFKRFLQESLTQYIKEKKYLKGHTVTKKWFYPYVVTNVSCEYMRDKKLLKINWSPPFNVREKDYLKYYLFILDQSKEFYKEIVTDDLSLQIDIPNNIKSKLQVWIWVEFDINSSTSPELYFECN